MISRREWAIIAAIFVLTRLGLGEIPPALGNSSTPITIAFSRSGADIPRYSTFNGSAWSASAAMPNIGGEAQWVVLKNCPTRNELAFAALDEKNDVNICIFNGTTWSGPTEVCANTFQNADRCMSLEYEHVSGDFLAVYWSHSGTKLGFRTYTGSSISAESLLTLPATDKIRFVTLVQKPYSNEIMLLAMNDSSDLYACIWNGSSFGSVTTIETNMKNDGYECFSGAYETVSGHFMLVYSESGQSTPRYQTCINGVWSGESSLPTVGATVNYIQLAADPTNDQMLVATLDTTNDLNANNWTGSAWGSNVELETDVGTNNRRKFGMGYLGGSSLAAIAYGEGTLNTPKYRYWTGSWQAENNGMDLGEKPGFIAFTPSQTANQVFCSLGDEGDDLSIAWAAGLTFNTIETSMGGSAITEPFMLSTPGPTTASPANIPYAADFQGTIGAEWTDTTNVTNGTYTKFLGRHRNNTIRLLLNTVANTRYSLVFDFYAIDSWDGNSATAGPDFLQVSVNGSQAFSKTFSHDPGWIADGCTHPYPADQYGSYGYSASYTDGVFRKVEVPFTASGSITALAFNGLLRDENNQGFNDESWGIDNVNVTVAAFLDVSSSTGFNQQMTGSEQDGSGFHWADLDADGDLDAIVTGGSTSRLMLNNLAAGTFTASSFGGGAVREQGALADYDNDGDMDFWSAEAGADGTQRLFTNNGSASFTNAGFSGFSGSGTNEGCGAVDADSDGWMDVVTFSDNGNWLGLNQKSSTVAFSATNASSYGLNGSGNYGARGYCSSGDINNDGYLDFFYRYNNGRLFVSDGDGTYTHNARGISVLTGGYEDTATALADFDNDRDLDLFVPRTTAGYTGSLWRNDVNWTAGTGNFTDVSTSAGLTLNNKPAPTANAGTRSGCWGDYDNDGDLDLFIVGANGNCLLYKNQGGGVLARTGEGISITGSGIDGVFVDYDNDGDLDLAVTRDGATAVLYQNQTNNSNYLKVRLIGVGDGATNKSAQGIRVEVWNSAGTSFIARREIGTARGYGGAEPFWAHFGGLNPNTAYTLKIYYDSLPSSTPYEMSVTPSAVSTTIGATTINQMVTITEPASNKKIMIWAEVRN